MCSGWPSGKEKSTGEKKEESIRLIWSPGLLKQECYNFAIFAKYQPNIPWKTFGQWGNSVSLAIH